LILALWVVSGCITFTCAQERATNTKTAKEKQVELTGRIVCLTEEKHALDHTPIPEKHAHVYGFKSKDETLYTLGRTKYSEALFVEPRLRSEDLILKGRIRKQMLEVERIRSLRDGVVYDVFYFCSVCNIESVSPGRCECCQGPVELTEKRIGTKP
jgi:hypothetical protein